MKIVERNNKRIKLKLTSYHEDAEVLEYMKTLENKADWIRNLTRKQMLKEKKNPLNGLVPNRIYPD